MATRTRRKVFAKIGPIELTRKEKYETKPRATAREADTSMESRPSPADTKEYATKTANRPGVEVGVSGNTGRYGYADNGEYVRKLQGQGGLKTFDMMRRSDPQVQAVLKALSLPIRQAQWFIEPASDDPKDIEIAEEAEADFFKNMTMTWDDTIRHILLMFPFGFSPLEKVWEMRDGKIRPRKMDPRLPQSIIRWDYDNKKNRLIGPVQMDTDGKEILLPIEKLMVFTVDKEGDNWEGISLLRAPYKPWYIKDTLEKVNAIAKERHGVGTPVLETPLGVSEDSDEWQKAIDAMEDFVANEKSYILTPEGWKFRIESGGGDKGGADSLPTIKYYDEKIAVSMLAMFMSLGSTETGSRALGGSFLEIFLLSLQAFADYIAEIFTRFALKDYVNFNWEVTAYPTMKVRRIRKLDPVVLAELKKAGLLSTDDTTENMIRDELNLPEKVEKEGGEEDPAPPTKKKVDEDAPPEDLEAQAHDHGWRFQQDREHTDAERLCNLDQIELRLDTETQILSDAILKMRDVQADKIILQVVGGRKAQDITVPLRKEMFDEMIREYKRQRSAGRVEVNEEINNQIPGKSFAAGDTLNVDEIFAIIEEQFALDVEGAADKLKTMIATAGLALKKNGVTGDALMRQLEIEVAERISDATWNTLASSSVIQGWGDGRRLEMDKHADEIERVERSAILDTNTCEVCLAKDGKTHELNDPEFITPDPECLGTQARCRCINIAIMKAENAPENV